MFFTRLLFVISYVFLAVGGVISLVVAWVEGQPNGGQGANIGLGFVALVGLSLVAVGLALGLLSLVTAVVERTVLSRRTHRGAQERPAVT